MEYSWNIKFSNWLMEPCVMAISGDKQKDH